MVGVWRWWCLLYYCCMRLAPPKGLTSRRTRDGRVTETRVSHEPDRNGLAHIVGRLLHDGDSLLLSRLERVDQHILRSV